MVNKDSYLTANSVKLEYLAVYGRASMAAFRQLSTHGQKRDNLSRASSQQCARGATKIHIYPTAFVQHMNIVIHRLT